MASCFMPSTPVRQLDRCGLNAQESAMRSARNHLEDSHQ